MQSEHIERPDGPLPPETMIGTRWLALLSGSVLLLVFVYGYRYWYPPASSPPVVAVEPAPTPAPATVITPTTDGLMDFKLPDGTTLRAAPDGVESKLLEFITNSGKLVDKSTWFTMDRLEFETASASLRESSNAQLDNLASILSAFPNVKIKLGGYTDNTGTVDANLKLSGERAASAIAALISRGVDSHRLEAEGYGEQFPVADNSTAEGRARNRRTDIHVTEK